VAARKGDELMFVMGGKYIRGAIQCMEMQICELFKWAKFLSLK
jgi:hypothetical protein